MKVRDLIKLIEQDGWYTFEQQEAIGTITTQPNRAQLFPGNPAKTFPKALETA
jgi:predicted RNA binding protein YcfA (HicA-like mRNA interferase family)